MNNVSIIASVGENFELGKNNDLIWHLPNDLNFFKNITMGKDIVMGSKTFYSLPRKLSGRRYIVLTGQDIEIPDVMVFRSKVELIRYLYQVKKEVMVIGGANVYSQMLEYADRMYLTHIEDSCRDADTYFPKFNYDEWDNEVIGMGADNGISYKHVLYKRKK